MRINLLKMRIRETFNRLRGKETNVERAKRKFLSYYKNTRDLEIKEMYNHIKNTGQFEMINIQLKHDWSDFVPTIKRDDQNNMPYAVHQGKRIYWPEKYNEKEVASQYKGILVEQDEYSPHRYLTDDDIDYIRSFKESGKNVICFECGAMEGLFTRTIIEYLDEAYLFECETDWKDALKTTFSDYTNRAHIISKFVSDHTGGDCIKIDDVFEEQWGGDLEKTLIIVKMDIEGAELKALEGMKKMLSEAKHTLLFVCAYHRQNDEKEIRDYFKNGYEITHTNGFFCFYTDPLYDEPYIRRCVMKIRSI